jgi:3-dehydroquinate dehydratase-1
MKHPLVLDPRGRKRGGDTPLVCTPLIGRTREQVLAEVAGILPKSPDLLEWRVDHFGAVADTAAVLDVLRELRTAAERVPIIFTCRSAKFGGHRVPVSVAHVVELCEAVAEARLVEFIDFELDHGAELIQRMRQHVHAKEIRLILSYHNVSYTPGHDFMVQQFLEAERLGADIAMVHVKPRDTADVLRLLAATAEADGKARIPLISMSIGPLGSVSRLVGGLFGSSVSFAVGEKASAPGQIPIGDLVAVLDILRRARGGEMA